MRWSEVAPRSEPGVYIVHARDRKTPLYIGESSDLGERHDTHSHRTYFSALRRHIATEVLGFTLKIRGGKAKYLDPAEDSQVSAFLDGCVCAFVPVSFGRFELEDRLIRKYRPELNRRGNDSAASEPLVTNDSKA